MKLGRTVAFAASVSVFSVFAIACGGSVEQPQTTASAVSKAPIAANSHGIVKVFGDALADVPLRAEQRAQIEKLAADAEARHAPMADGRKELMLAFADQVEHGAIDRAALQPKVDRVTGDLEKSRADDRAALVKLHDLLDNEQRNTFVDALEKQFKGKRGEHMQGGFGKLKVLADELKLTDDQKSQIRDAMRGGGHERMHMREGVAPELGPREGKQTLEAFRQDKLDLERVAPPRDLKAAAQAGTEHMTAFAQKVLPILTPEQRKIAADKIRTMAASGDAALLVH